jgi:hypothetical protein
MFGERRKLYPLLSHDRRAAVPILRANGNDEGDQAEQRVLPPTASQRRAKRPSPVLYFIGNESVNVDVGRWITPGGAAFLRESEVVPAANKLRSIGKATRDWPRWRFMVRFLPRRPVDANNAHQPPIVLPRRCRLTEVCAEKSRVFL